jgi:1-deoxy-D-xylulose-5-phosphate reductoisomerase
MSSPPRRRRLAVFGSTGSVGRSTLRVAEALSDVFEEQAARARHAVVAIADPDKEAALRAALPADFRGVVRSGRAALAELAAADDVDVVLNAVVGAAGLPVSLAAARAGKRLALANKESLVAAGPLLLRTARDSGAEILPVDSEHCALFQALMAGRRGEVKKLILTGSGGPFRTRPKETFATVTKDEALRHPTWSMGPKITVDSATMMNKALEIVEACRLFDAPPEEVDVVIHPQSIVHSMVLYRDGSVIAQMSKPDMRTAVQFALTYPDRLPSDVDAYGLDAFKTLTFEAPDPDKFPSLEFGRRAAADDGVLGAVLNAANERAVELFLAGEIAFTEIFRRVERALDAAPRGAASDLDAILAADRRAREEASVA